MLSVSSFAIHAFFFLARWIWSNAFGKFNIIISQISVHHLYFFCTGVVAQKGKFLSVHTSFIVCRLQFYFSIIKKS